MSDSSHCTRRLGHPRRTHFRNADSALLALAGSGCPVSALPGRRLQDRGRYAGPVGWMDRAGNGEFAIALRCAEISGARARLFTGAGIMSDSLPENELEETRLKLDAMMSALE